MCVQCVCSIHVASTCTFGMVQDALRAKRRHEEFEREWRRKEKDEAQKK